MGTKTTARLNLTFPTAETDPWFDIFEALMGQLDAVGFAAREDRNLFIGGGGTLTWNSTTGLLSWDESLTLFSPLVGGVGSIPPGSVTISDGDSFWTDITRFATDNYGATPNSSTVVPNSNNALVLAHREGTKLIWWSGPVFDNGYTGPLYVGQGTGGGGGGSATAFEDVSAQIDGVNLVFSVTQPYTVGSTRVYLNGQNLGPVAAGNFSESGAASITLSIAAPTGGMELYIEYLPL